MAEETNNPGRLAAAAYRADPANVSAPTSTHHEFEKGVRADVLIQIQALLDDISTGVGALIPTADQKAAMDAANSPAAGNPFSTMDDLAAQASASQSAYDWRVDTGAPADGEIKMDNADPTLATVVKVANITRNGTNMSNISLLLGDSDAVVIADNDDVTKVYNFDVDGDPTQTGGSGSGGYVEIPVAFFSQGTGGTIADTEIVNALFRYDGSNTKFLAKASNLSDLSNLGTARTNLDVYSKGEVYTKSQGDARYLIGENVIVARAMSTSNITLAGAQTIDGVSLVPDDLCLVTGQTSGADNGVYSVEPGGWTRDTSLLATTDAFGKVFAAAEGTTNGSTIHMCSNVKGSAVVGTDALTFEEVGGSAGGTWGSITGTLSNQTDLQSALDAKGSGVVTNAMYNGLANRLAFLSLKGLTDDALTGPTGGLDWRADMFENGEYIDGPNTTALYDPDTDSFSTSHDGGCSFGSIALAGAADTTVTAFTIGGAAAISGTVDGEDFDLLIQGDESTGSSFPDQSSNDLGVTLTGTGMAVSSTNPLSFATDCIGKTVANDKLTIDNSGGELNIGTDWTMQGFYRLDSVDGSNYNSAFLNIHANTDNYMTIIGHHSAYSGPSLFTKLDGTEVRIDVGGSPEAADTWYHVMAVKEGNTLAFYWNGTRAGTLDVTGEDFTVFNAKDYLVGRSTVEQAYGLVGALDQIKISPQSEAPGLPATITVPTSPFGAAFAMSMLTDAINAGPLNATWTASCTTPTASSGTVVLTADAKGISTNDKAIAGTPTNGTFSAAVDTAWGAVATTNGKLQTIAFTAAAVPATIRPMMIHEWGTGTQTMNTDLVVSASRDGGTTWTAGTMVDQGEFLPGQKQWACDIDVSSQPSGTDVRIKMQGANSDESILHGLALQAGV